MEMSEQKQTLTDVEFQARRQALLHELDGLCQKYELHAVVMSFGFDEPGSMRGSTAALGCASCALQLIEGLARNADHAIEKVRQSAASAHQTQQVH